MLTLSDLNLEKLSPEEIGELLIEAKKAYYTGGKPIMDDHTYDTLEEVLRTRYPQHRIFTKVGSANFDTGFDKKEHLMAMGSQNKVNALADLVHYFELKGITSNAQFVVQPKCDGLSLEMVYHEGKFMEAITRGDGKVGDVITQNVVKMKNFVPQVPHNFSGSVRLEIVVTYEDFDTLNKISDESYSNPRNAASGISQRLDRKYSEYCTLYAVDVWTDDRRFATEYEQVEFLKSLGITVVDSYLVTSYSQVEDIYQKFLTGGRGEHPFEIDGLVIKLNDLSTQLELGTKNNRPKGQVAYKFPARSNESRIKTITWQVGPLGSVTPVAEVDPIEVSGAVITFASLANYDLVKEKNINIGDVIEISRRGDVIPHIEKVITKVTPGTVDIPSVCPSCSTPLIVENKFLRCPNAAGCLPQVLGALRLFCDTLEIKGISDKTIEKLYSAGRLRLPGDFYDLTVDSFSDLAGLGEKSGRNIVNQIQAKRELSLVQVFDAAVIPNFSAQRIQQLIDAGFDTPEKLLSLKASDLLGIPGFQSTLAAKIEAGITLRRSAIESILSHITLKTVTASSGNLSGLAFAITGELSRPRKAVETDIQSAGGKLASSVTKNTSYLVTNETSSSSSKFVSAQKLGVKIISEDELYSLINSSS